MISTSPAVIVTGASSGIGAACARAFARAGLPVALAARREDRLVALADEIASAGGRALAVPADVTDPESMRRLASRTLAAFGRIDTLVCSAGLGYFGLLEDTPPAVLRRLVEVNVVGTLNAARAVVPYFEAQRGGQLIVINSIVGKRGFPGYAAYCASKFAQAGLAESLRAELRGSGVAVTTVFPVSSDTGFRAAIEREFGVRVHGGGPSLAPEAIADAVVRSTRRRPAEIYPLRRARLLVWLTAVAPRWGDRLARRFARVRAEDPASTHTEG
jgi:NADP-dependent 3-hydroxy acid dehydrogenase YdfG